MSAVSLENGSDNLCAGCEVRLLQLNMNRSVSVVSLKNPSELQCIVLVNKCVKIMSAVSLENLGGLHSIALIVILSKLCRKENKSISL